MPVVAILGSLLLVLIAYAVVAFKERSVINPLTPMYVMGIPAFFLIELLHIHYNGYSANNAAYLVCYGGYALHFVAIAVAYTVWTSRPVRLPFAPIQGSIGRAPYWLLLLAILVYLPVLLEFHDWLATPRLIYEHTRSGYGHYFFVSSMFTFLAWIMMLFKEKGGRWKSALFFLLCAAACFLHGSKSQVMMLVFYWLLFQCCVRGKRYGLFRASFTLGAVGVAIAVLLVTLAPGRVTSGNFLRLIAGYADYNRNAMMVIDDQSRSPAWGKLTLEQTVYSRVPRVLDPNKPDNWGTFSLAHDYYPEWHRHKVGSPSFGILGLPYADFGLLGLAYMFVWAVIGGILLKIFTVRLRTGPTPSDFIMLIFMSGLVVIPSGTGTLLVEHVVLALVVSIVGRWRWVLQPDVGSEGRPEIEMPPC
jgi:hypothetical protein